MSGLGLGITFLPSPSPPSQPTLDHTRYNEYESEDRFRKPHPSTNGPTPAEKQQETKSASTLRKQRSYHQQLRPEQSYYDAEKQQVTRSRTASSPLEKLDYIPNKGSRDSKDDVGVDYRQRDLSPLSEFEHSSSDDGEDLQDTFSPASLSSLPSSTSSGAAYYPQYQQPPPASRHTVRHAQSMMHLQAGYEQPYQREQSTHPEQLFQPRPRLPLPPTEPAPSSETSSQARSPSRLPAFLLDRTRREAALSRPKSMMELGKLAAAQSIEKEPSISNDVHLRYHDRRQEAHEDRDQSIYSGSEAGGERDHIYDGIYSPESIPSSAGGLLRQQLERQLHDQSLYHQQAMREQQERNERHQQHLPTHDAGSAAAPYQQQAIPPRPSRSHLRSQSDSAALSPQYLTTLPLNTVPQQQTVAPSPARSVISTSSSTTSPTKLNRTSTLFSAGANPTHRAKELDRLLAPPSGIKKVPSLAQLGAIATPASVAARSVVRAPSTSSSALPFGGELGAAGVVLEQAKNTHKARVELDLILESSLLVEGGCMKGKIELRIREENVWVGRLKVRVVGFEELTNHEEGRHVFYHHASSVSTLAAETAARNNTSPAPVPTCFDGRPDGEGFSRGRLGQHSVPFSMILPIGKGAKGSWKGKQGVVRYIVIVSVKLKSQSGADRSIAHFYRHVEIFPYLNPAVVLASALKPLAATVSKSLFMGGSGLVNLSARIHRSTWIAGQRCYVDVSVENESSKKVKTLTLSLIRTTTVLRPRPWQSVGEATLDDDAGSSQATKKKVADSILEMGKKAAKGVTAKGSWMGVDKGERTDFSHFILVPPEELSIGRGRHLEVSYSIKISVSGSLSADVSTEIPIKVINFVSIDPPPGHTGDSARYQPHAIAKSWSIDQLRAPTPNPTSAAASAGVRKFGGQTVDRMISLDSLRLSELNLGATRFAGQSIARTTSLDTLRTSNLSYVEPAPAATHSHSTQLPVRPGREIAVVVKAKERSLQHQMSLDCITSAIASATARRGNSDASGRSGHSRTPSALRVEIERTDDGEEKWDENDDEEMDDDDPYDGATYSGGGEQTYATFGAFAAGDSLYPEDEGSRVQLDDLDEDELDAATESDSNPSPPSRFDSSDSSDDELEAVMSQTCFEEEEPTPFDSSLASTLRVPPSPTRAQQRPATPQRSPNTLRSSPSFGRSPMTEVAAAPLRSALKQPRNDGFGYATPTSPIKPTVPLPLASPIRRQASRAELSPAMPTLAVPVPSRAAARLSSRPLVAKVSSPPTAAPKSLLRPITCSVPRNLASRKSTSNLKRVPEMAAPIIAKRQSSRSLRTSSAAQHQYSNASSPDIDALSPRITPDGESHSARSTDRYTSDTRSLVHARTTGSSAYTRPVGEGRSVGGMTGPALPRKNSILPAIRNQVAAFETREEALANLRATNGPDGNLKRVPTMLNRADSIMSTGTSEAGHSMLTRENSTMSFKAPMFRQNHREI